MEENQVHAAHACHNRACASLSGEQLQYFLTQFPKGDVRSWKIPQEPNILNDLYREKGCAYGEIYKRRETS